MSERRDTVLKLFEEQKDLIEQRCREGIENYRKGYCRIRFQTKEGAPVNHVHLKAVQTDHDFKHGANIFMLDEMETEEKNRLYRDAFHKVFNLATIPFYWYTLEPEQGKVRFEKGSPKIYRRPSPDLCMDYCREMGIEPKLHCLTYDQFTPLWMPADAFTVWTLLEQRYRQISERYGSSIPMIEVINETLCPVRDTLVSHSSVVWNDPLLVERSFKLAEKYFISNKLIINEGTENVWGPNLRLVNRMPYYMQIERAIGKNCRIDGIGMQFHIFGRPEDEKRKCPCLYNPQQLYGIMDQYAQFGLPLQVTEITIPCHTDSKEDEDLQAEIIKNLYTIWFSHPAMEAVIYWNLVDGYAYNAEPGDFTAGENITRAGLMRFDMTMKPAYHTIRKLFHETWHTEAELDSGEGNTVEFRAFRGDYDLEIDVGGRTIRRRIQFHKGLDLPAGIPVVL